MGLAGDAVDLTERVERFGRERSKRAEDMRRMAEDLGARRPTSQTLPAPEAACRVGALLTLAFPDRIAKARGKRGEFLMANGRGGSVDPHDRLAQRTVPRRGGDHRRRRLRADSGRRTDHDG